MIIVLGKVIGIFIMVLIGYGANKIGWLPVQSSKYLSKIVINIAAPCVVIHSMSQQELSIDSVKTMLIVLGCIFVSYIFSWAFSIFICWLMKVPEDDKGIYKNFLIFTNNAFMGFPVALALFGSEGMFLMVVANLLMPVFMYTLGSANLNPQKHKSISKFKVFKQQIKEVINAPVIATFAGLTIFLLQIPLPVLLTDVLSSVGAMMAPLCMIIIGIQLTESKPSQVILNKRLIFMCFLRLIFLPAVFFLATNFLPINRLIVCIVTLTILLPCAAVPVALTEEYGRNVKLAAEGTFLSTLLSMLTIPVFGILLTLYVL